MLSKIRNPFEKIYCISLPFAKKRREYFSHEITSNALHNYQFIDAVNQNDDIVAYMYENKQVKLFPPCFRCNQKKCICDNNVLIPAQVASFLSHKSAWEKIAKQKNGLYLIVEDDVKFNRYYQYLKYMIHWKINTLFRKSCNEPFILRLGWKKDKDHSARLITASSSIEKPTNSLYGLNPKMAQKLLHESSSITTTVDTYINLIAKNQVTHFTLFPPLAYDLSSSSTMFQSSVLLDPRYIESLKKQKDKAANKELESYYVPIKKTIHRKLIIIGHPRTGTAYTGELLKSFGLDIGHEKMGKDGIVSWMFNVYDLHNPFYKNNYAKSRFFSTFDHVILCVRDPYTAIPSIIRENHDAYISLKFRQKHILKAFGIDIFAIHSPIEQAIAVYYYWSKIALEKNNPEIITRIEKDDQKLFNYLESCGYNIQYANEKLPPKNINADKTWMGKVTPKPELTKNDWLGIAQSYKQMLNELCEVFNYDLIYDKRYENIIRE